MIRLIKLIILLSILVSAFLFVECSSRVEIAVSNSDSTITFPPKDENGISANISLCRRVSHKSGELIGKGRVFTIMEKEKIVANIDLENRFLNSGKELLFHVYWLHENGKSIYEKQIKLAPDDSASAISSSISISPEKRSPGKYLIRLYYFRELIAEKYFEILPEFTKEQLGGKLPDITFYRKRDRKSGNLIGIDSVFTIGKKHKVRAFVDLKDRTSYGNRELRFHFRWNGPDGESVFSKHYSLLPGDSISSIRSSISNAPDKRQAGDYSLQVFLFNKLLTEKKFSIKEEPKFVPVKKSYKISADISLCRKVSKKTGNAIGESSVFTIGDKARVTALVKLAGLSKYADKKLVFYLNWIGPDGKSFFKKQVDSKSLKSGSEIKSSISIASGKRKPGHYKLQIFLFNKLISEKGFELVEN